MLCILGEKGLLFFPFIFLGSGKKKVWFCPFEKLQAVEVTAHQILFYVIYIFYFLNKAAVKCLADVFGFHQIAIILGIATEIFK